MSSFSQTIIVGNLGQDVEVRYSTGGVAFATISVATSETWKDKGTGEKKERTDWHRCKASGRLAEIMGEYLKKGTKVFVSGQPRSDKFTDKEGVERYDHYIRVDQMRMLDKREGGEGKPAQARQAAPRNSAPPASESLEDDDIPF